MAARRSHPVVRGARSARQGTDWARATQLTPASLGIGVKIILASVTLSNPGIAETVRRTILDYTILSDQVAVTEVQSGALGMIVVNDVVAALGITAVPGPVTDRNDDGWLLW